MSIKNIYIQIEVKEQGCKIMIRKSTNAHIGGVENEIFTLLSHRVNLNPWSIWKCFHYMKTKHTFNFSRDLYPKWKKWSERIIKANISRRWEWRRQILAKLKLIRMKKAHHKWKKSWVGGIPKQDRDDKQRVIQHRKY